MSQNGTSSWRASPGLRKVSVASADFPVIPSLLSALGIYSTSILVYIHFNLWKDRQE